MELLLRIVMYMVLSSLLVYSAYSDYRTRRIPFGVGLGLLLTAAVILVIEKMYWEALFLVVAVIGSRGGMWSLLVYLSAMLLFGAKGETAALPMVVGILLFNFMFSMRWIGGGDAQVAFALIAVGHEWMMLYLVLGFAVVAGLVMVFRKYDLKGGLSRLWVVTRRLNKSSEKDENAIRSPWIIWAAIGGMCYLYLIPGPVTALISSLFQNGLPIQ